MHTNVEKWAKEDIVLWRSYEVITVNYFCVQHKNRRKHNQHFKQLFFKTNLHLSDYISTYGKLNLLSINNIFLSSLLEKCKENWCRPKYTTSFLYPVLKEASYKPLKAAAAKKSFQVCLSLIQLASMNVFHSVW